LKSWELNIFNFQ